MRVCGQKLKLRLGPKMMLDTIVLIGKVISDTLFTEFPTFHSPEDINTREACLSTVLWY